MSERYKIYATIPMQVGRGKIADAEKNTREATAEDPKKRNEEYGYIEIPAKTTVRAKNRREGTGKDR